MVISYLLRPKSKLSNAERPNLASFEYPTNDSSRVVPEIFGTVLVRGCQYIYGGAVRVAEIRVTQKGRKGKGGGSQVVGYAWFASFALSVGGVVDEFIEMRRDGKVIWSGSATANGSVIYAQTGQAYEPGGSGTGHSALTLYMGTQTAAIPQMAAWTGYNVSYKGKSVVIANDVFVGDGVSSAPSYDFVVKRTALIPNGTGGLTWSTHSAINAFGNYADCNPAHVLLYILLRPLKINEAMIDCASFHTCGITLHAEGLGCSFSMDIPHPAEHWAQEILRTVDAVLYHDVVVNKTKMQLMRNDYSIPALTTLTDNDMKRLELDRQAWEDFPTETTIKYTDRNSFNSAAFRVKNPAARKMLGYNKPDDYSYMIVSNLTAIQGVMARLMKKLFYPLLVVKFSISRAAFPAIAVGQCVKLTSSTFGFSNMVVRITNIGSDTFAEQEMEVEAIQDPYGLADLELSPGAYSLAQPYDWTVGPIAEARVIDAPAEVADTAAVLVMYTPPSGTPAGVKHYLSGEYQMTGSPRLFGRGVLSTTLSAAGATQHVNVIQDSAEFDVASCVNVVDVAATRAAFQRLKFTLIIGSPGSGWEIIGYQFCTFVSGTTYRVRGLMRGLNNSVIQTHSPGLEVWFCWVDANEMPALPVNPASINASLIGFNQRYVGVEKTVPAYTYGFTQAKPYPVSNVKAARNGNDIALTWCPCRRLGLSGYQNPDNIAAGNDTPEGFWQVRFTAGTEQVVDVFGTSAIMSYTRTDATYRTYHIRSVLDGFVSAERSISI